MFWVISVQFDLRNTLPKSGTFLLGHPVYHNGQHSHLREEHNTHLSKSTHKQPVKFKCVYQHNNKSSFLMSIQGKFWASFNLSIMTVKQFITVTNIKATY